jgi:hypothetical protein
VPFGRRVFPSVSMDYRGVCSCGISGRAMVDKTKG